MSTPRFRRSRGWIRRRRRHLGWYRNDMRRTSDRWETGLVAVLLVVFLAVLPFIAYTAGRQAYRDDVRRQAWNDTHRMHTEAVLLADAAPPAVPTGPRPTPDPALALAWWTAPDGTTRQGTVEVTFGQRAGTRVGMWMDEHGSSTTAPDPLHPAADAANVATVVALGGCVVLLALRVLLRVLLHRRRLRTWQQEWLEVGPRWSRHR